MAWDLPWREETQDRDGHCSTIVDATGEVITGEHAGMHWIEDDPRATILEAVNGRPALLERVAALEAMLREIQWAETISDVSYCPVCRSYEAVGHERDCRLAALLAPAQ